MKTCILPDQFSSSNFHDRFILFVIIIIILIYNQDTSVDSLKTETKKNLEKKHKKMSLRILVAIASFIVC